jgi:hypothetical protein
MASICFCTSRTMAAANAVVHAGAILAACRRRAPRAEERQACLGRADRPPRGSRARGRGRRPRRGRSRAFARCTLRSTRPTTSCVQARGFPVTWSSRRFGAASRDAAGSRAPRRGSDSTNLGRGGARTDPRHRSSSHVSWGTPSRVAVSGLGTRSVEVWRSVAASGASSSDQPCGSRRSRPARRPKPWRRATGGAILSLVIRRVLRVASSFAEADELDRRDVAELPFEERMMDVEGLRRQYFGEHRVQSRLDRVLTCADLPSRSVGARRRTRGGGTRGA